MSGFRTQYTRLNSNSDDPEEDLPPQGFDIGARGFEEVEKGIQKMICIYIRFYVQFVYSMYSCNDRWFLGGKVCRRSWIIKIQACEKP